MCCGWPDSGSKLSDGCGRSPTRPRCGRSDTLPWSQMRRLRLAGLLAANPKARATLHRSISRESAAPHPESVIRRSTLASVRWKTSGGWLRDGFFQVTDTKASRSLRSVTAPMHQQHHVLRLLADSEPFRTPVPIESVHRFRRFRTPAEEKLVACLLYTSRCV